MVWITMSLTPLVGNRKRKKNESKPHSQINKCLNEKRRREQENIHIEELAELVSASPSDMSSLSCKPDKCAILKETVNQIRSQKHSKENELCDDLQQSEVSSSKPNIINNQIFGSILLEALEGFLFVVNIDGKVEFVSENIVSFLKYNHEEVYEKNIYDFIHLDDRARFNSNLLLMMPLGNGRDWSTENNFSSGKPTKHFNCRFLVKQEEPGIRMENKPPQDPQYESLNITANYIPLSDGGGDEIRNGLTCIARRVAYEDKRIGSNKVEQFTTRIDRDGKVVDLDTSMLSQSSGQYIRKELLGALMTDFCHPNDLATLKQHLKETFDIEGATCVPYKFRIGPDRYVRIKTKSRRFHNPQTNEEYVVSTHSVIRDCDSSSAALEVQKSVPSPSSAASTSSGPGSVSDSSTSINGSIVLSPMALSNSYGNYSNSLSAQNNSDYVLSDLVLDMFPSSNWNIDPGSAQSKDSDCTSVTSLVSSPQTAPLSNRSETNAAASPTNSAFVSGLTSSRSGSSVPSPVVQSRAPTPYGGSCYSPSASQSSSGRSSPPRALSAKSDSLNCSSTDTSGIININQGMRMDKQQFDIKSNQKLRNLLTQNSDDSASRQVSRQASQDDVTVLIESRVLDDPSQLTRTNNQNVSQTSNVILRDLLNQEDSEVPVEPIHKGEGAVPNPLLNAGACKTIENSAQQRLGNNNMLRKLLNNDDTDRNYRKHPDLIHQLLISNAGASNKISSLPNERLRSELVPNVCIAESTVPKQISLATTRGNTDISYSSEVASMKRKANDKAPPPTKKAGSGANHAHLAGANPMLASMLARAAKPPPPVSISATNIMTQLPQERLPKNLEKKLVHTPCTASLNSTTSSQVFTSTTPTLQRDVVTSDSRGHVLQQSLQLNAQSAQLRTMLTQQQQQLLYDRLANVNDDSILLAKSAALGLSNMDIVTIQTPTNNQLTTSSSSDTLPTNLTDILSDVNLVVGSPLSDSLPMSQASDALFAGIVDDIFSLHEDHKLLTQAEVSNDKETILKKLIDSVENPTPPRPPPQPQRVSVANSLNSAQELTEKIAINAIQKELMEIDSAANASIAISIPNASVIPTFSQAGQSHSQSVQPQRTTVQAQLTSEQILLLQQQQQQILAGSLPPNYNLVTSRVRLPVTTQANVNVLNQDLLVQAQRRNLQMVRNVTVGNANINQFRKAMKQKLYLQQQQKRLLEQQQKQQMTMQTQQPLETATSAGNNAFPENMNDLLNNTVAPNVTLLRSSGIPEVPGSARFNLTSASSLPSPTSQASPTSAQLSPGQRVNQPSPFSPHSQQPFPSQTPPLQTPPPATYQTSRLSPLPPPSYPQKRPSHSTSPNSSTASSPHMVLSPQSTAASPQWTQRIATSPIQNLQLQNPMLNAQLSQGANRLTLLQRQQLALRTVSSPTSVQTVRGSAVFSQQSDTNFSSLSPVMVLQSQAPQQPQQQQQQPPQQQRVQRSRIASGSQNQPNFSTSEPILSPQSLPSPGFSSSVSTTPTSTFVSVSSTGVPVTYSLAPVSQHFTFERQNIQAYTTSPNDSIRTLTNEQGTSVSLSQQELRSLVNSQNHLVLSSNNNQHVIQSLPSGSVTRVLNVQSLTREALEELGLSVELLPGETPSGSHALYAQAMLNDASSLENSAQPVSPMVQLEEPKPADQKKSLLQQLLSEPT